MPDLNPHINVPPDRIIVSSDGSAVPVNYFVTASDPEDGFIEVHCTPPSGSSFSLGATPVDCQASDSGGNTAQAAFHIIVTRSAGKTAGGWVGPEGGFLTTFDGSLGMEILPGALSANTYLSIADTGPSYPSSYTLADGTAGIALYGVTIEPAGTTFNPPATIYFTWNDGPPADGYVDGTGTPGIAENSLIIAKDGAKYAGPCSDCAGSPCPVIGCSTCAALCDLDFDYFSFEVCSLSKFVLLSVALDTTPPAIVCPADMMIPCNPEPLVAVTFNVTVTDVGDPSPQVVCAPPSGSGFPVGETTVTCTATDASGNSSSCAFKVSRAPLVFTGFLPPIGGADATGGDLAHPVRTFKMGSTIPVKFTASCEGAPILTGAHSLQVIKFGEATTGDSPIDATPQDAATAGNEFRLADGEWHLNLDTKATGMSVGIWRLIATLSDGSTHSAWIQLK